MTEVSHQQDTIEFDLSDPAFMSDPAAADRWLSRPRPICRGRFADGFPMWVVTRYDEVKAVLTDPRFTSTPPGDLHIRSMRARSVPEDVITLFNSTLLTMDGADHARVRTLISPALTARRMQAMRPYVERVVASLLDELADKPEPDVIADFSYPVAVTVVCELLGVDERYRPQWRKWSEQLKAELRVDATTMVDAVRGMIRVVRELIAARSERPTDDLLTDLVRSHEEEGDRLGTDELAALAMVLVQAGLDTVSNLIALGVLTLLRHPDQLAAMGADPRRMPGVVSELIRYAAPVKHAFRRFATERVAIGGVTIEQGEALQVVLATANRDPSIFDDPGTLDVTRTAGAHLGFGFGRHYCLGAALAQVEGEVALSALFQRFPDIRLALPAPVSEYRAVSRVGVSRVSYHIAVVNHGGLGHVIPTLDVVGELVRRGHRVTYATAGAGVDLVKAVGATVVEYESVLATVDMTTLDTVDGATTLLQYGVMENEAILAAMECHFAADRPDLVAYDATLYAAGRILARKWELPAVALCPVFVSNEHFSFLDRVIKNMGPTKPRHPGDFANLMLKLLADHGQNDVSLQQFMRHVANLHIAFYPKSFQFAGETFDDRFAFVGPNADDNVGAGSWTPPSDGKPVLLVSLGTSVHRRPGFFRMCVDTFRDMPWHVVMTVPDRVALAEVGPLPPNVQAHHWLPLRAVLAHSDVFVCHGGMGSLMAALSKAVPVIVIPESPETMVNADRVVELGLGRVIAPAALTADVLRDTVREVSADPVCRQRAREMCDDIGESGGGARGADAIVAHLDRAHAVPAASVDVTPSLSGPT
jgi:MGT family glycosyltransferase